MGQPSPDPAQSWEETAKAWEAAATQWERTANTWRTWTLVTGAVSLLSLVTGYYLGRKKRRK
jgi:hypothetical protein